MRSTPESQGVLERGFQSLGLGWLR
jgi:hypothetical protein